MKITVFDVETNGFNMSYPRPCSPVSFAWQTWDKTITKLHDSGVIYFSHPSIFFDKGAYNVHGLSQEFLDQYKDQFYDNLAKMFKILYRGRLVGHNLDKFDIPMCEQFLNRFGYGEILPTKTYDTMKIYRPYYHKNPKLAEALEDSDISDETIKLLNGVWFKDNNEEAEFHSATFDVTATSLLFKQELKNGWCEI